MGDIRPGDGGAVPPDDGDAHLADLPPEWGDIVIPDDAAELDREARALRREMRRNTTHAGTRRQTLAVPAVIVLVAVLTTVISLAVVTAGSHPVPRAPQATGDVSRAGRTARSAGALGEINLVDPTGAPVRLATLLPAVIVLVDGCSCPRLILDIARAVPPGVTVVALATTPPVIFGAPTNVRTLAAPADSPLRTRYAAGASASPDASGATTSPGATGASTSPHAATALVVDRHGSVAALVARVETAADITPVGPL